MIPGAEQVVPAAVLVVPAVLAVPVAALVVPAAALAVLVATLAASGFPPFAVHLPPGMYKLRLPAMDVRNAYKIYPFSSPPHMYFISVI